MINKVYLVGFAGADAECRITQNGVEVMSFSLATSRQSGNDEKTQWHDVILWRPSDLLKDKIKKGTKVFIEGEIVYSSFKDKFDNFIKRAQINCFRLEICDSMKAQQNQIDSENEEQLIDDIPY